MRTSACIVLMSIGIAGCESLPSPGPSTLEVVRYEVALDLGTDAIRGVVHATALAEGNCFMLDEASPGLATLTVNGEGAAMTRPPDAPGKLEICGPAVFAGDPIEIEYSLTLVSATLSNSQVGYSKRLDIGGQPFTYLLSWVGECGRFGPCDANPARFAKYRFEVTHPVGTHVLCPGTVTPASATLTTCDFSFDGGPTYSTYGIMAYPAWQATPLGTWGGVTVTGYERTNGKVLSALDVAYFDGFMQWMQTRFGTYPYGSELRLAVAPTYWAGFEHPGNIILDDSLGGGATHTLLHEIVHQWAGDETTLASVYDFVWKEAMAEYLSWVYESETKPEVAATTNAGWKNYGRLAAYHPVPEEMPALFSYYGDAYGPGPMVMFRQLEAASSREAVLAALQTVLGQQRSLSVDEIRVALEATTGMSLAAYFDAWIYGSGEPAWPVVSVGHEASATPGQRDIEVSVQNPQQPALGCNFELALRGAQPGEEVRVPVTLLGSDGVAATSWSGTVAEPAFAITDVVVDPDADCLVYEATTSAMRPEPRRGAQPWLAPAD